METKEIGIETDIKFNNQFNTRKLLKFSKVNRSVEKLGKINEMKKQNSIFPSIKFLRNAGQIQPKINENFSYSKGFESLDGKKQNFYFI